MPNIRHLPVADLVDVQSGYHNQSELGGLAKRSACMHNAQAGRSENENVSIPVAI